MAPTLAGFAILLAGQPVWGQVRHAASAPPVEDALTLRDAVEIALTRNQRIAMAQAGLGEAEQRVREAWGNLYPTIDLSMTYTRNISPAVNFLPASFLDPTAPPDERVAVQFGADNDWNGLVDVQQALFKPAVFIGVGAAGRFESLQEEVVRGETQTVVTQVRRVFYDLLLAQEQHRLTDNSVQRVRQTLEETRALNRAGLSSDYDVLRLEVELANLEPNLLRAENAIRQAGRSLNVLLDRRPNDPIEVAGSLASIVLDDFAANTASNQSLLDFVGVGEEGGTEPASLVEAALAVRTDVRQADLTMDLRKTEMRLEQVEYLPEISLFGAYQVNASHDGDPRFFGSPRAYGRRVGVMVTLPVFNGFQREARIGQRRATLRMAEAQARLTRDQAESEVRALADQVAEAGERARAQLLAVGQARRGFEIASAQYGEGIGSQLEVTDAEVALRESEFNYAQAVYDYLVGRARLDQAIGRVPLVVAPDGT